MWKQKASRLLAVLLAVLLLSQAAAFQTLAFAAEDVVPELQNGTAVIPYGADLATMNDILCKALVSNASEVDAQSLDWEYYCTGKNGLLTNDAWGSIDGFTTEKKGMFVTTEYTHPRLSENGDGEYQVRLAGTEDEVTLTRTFPTPAEITLNSDVTISLAFNEDLSVNFDAVREAIWKYVVATTTPDMTLDDVTITYYSTAPTAVGSLGKAWMPLEGGKEGIYTYPAITEGSYKIRISFNGNMEYSANSAETTVNFVDQRTDVQVKLKEGPYEVGMVFNDDLSYNYAAVEQAIFDAVVESSDPELTLDDVTIEYNDKILGIDHFKALSSGLDLGDQEIRFSWAETTEYKGGSFKVTVTVSDNRIASTIVFKEGATITYNMDPEVMKQDLFENAIDWSASTLPADASIDDFSFEYYATAESGTIGNLGQNWVPIEGGTVSLLTYPQMGAGENQQVRISYKGNAEYRPVQKVEGAVTVNKATVKVTVHSTSIYPDQSVPEGFVTLNPNDPAIDIYTIYAGLTSDVDACVYVQLPARLTDSAVLKILDPIVAAFSDGKTLTQMMQEGMTVGELRELLSGLIDALNSVTDSSIGSAALRGLGIDPEALSQMLTLINKLPGIADNVRVAFGTPNRAGLYTVIAVTSNENYETAYGMGMLLVKMRVVGVKLEWNQDISKLTVEEAATADFGAHVTYNGEAVDSDNVHYLYSGITSSWRIYSSTTTAPTEPGRYTVTVVTLGGSYLATPLTRSFQITK